MSGKRELSPALARETMRVAFLEGFWGGSHRAVAEGWASSSRHRVEVFHLPPRFWKWRMRAAAFAFARQLREQTEPFDAVFATSVLDLAHLRAFLPRRVPAVLYFHENQASYPAPGGESTGERDLSYAFTDLAGALAADRVAFNSEYQREAFFDSMGGILRRMPDSQPRWALDEVRDKSEVLALGVRFDDIPPRKSEETGMPLVVWNHRWEYDKNPELFFGVLRRLVSRGVDFRVVVLGESFRQRPPVFEAACRWLGDRVVHWGYVPDRQEYVALLARGDVVVSTAVQENFGLSLLEAAFAGAHPLAPRRLSYPEVLPPEFHEACLYEDEPDLEAQLEGLLTGRRARLKADVLRASLRCHGWEKRAPVWDAFVAQVSGQAKLWYK